MRFRGSVFCGREELLWVQSLTFLTFEIIYMHKNVQPLKGRRKKKHNRCPLSKPFSDSKYQVDEEFSSL